MTVVGPFQLNCSVLFYSNSKTCSFTSSLCFLSTCDGHLAPSELLYYQERPFSFIILMPSFCSSVSIMDIFHGPCEMGTWWHGRLGEISVVHCILEMAPWAMKASSPGWFVGTKCIILSPAVIMCPRPAEVKKLGLFGRCFWLFCQLSQQ